MNPLFPFSIRKYGPLSLFLGSVSMLASPFTTAEQEAPEVEPLALEEIIITARKRFDTIQDVPISIVAKSGVEIENKSIDSLDELSFHIPNFHVGKAAGTRSLFIRGIGSGDNTGLEQTVGTYVDGVYYGRAELSLTPFFDTERVEILKGPQSILFGKNTVAGAINITTADPTDEFSFEISGLYENELNERKLEGFVSGPLADDLSGRVAFRASKLDGWLKNVQPNGKTEDTPNEDQIAARFGLAYSGIEDLSIVAKLALVSFKTEGSLHQLYRCSLPLVGILLINGASDDCGMDHQNSIGGRYIPATGPGPGFDFGDSHSDLGSTTFSLSADYDMGDYELSSITSFLDYDYEYVSDPDATALSYGMYELLQDYQQIGEELRLTYIGSNRYEWLAGIFLQGTEFSNAPRGHANSSDFPAALLPPAYTQRVAATTSQLLEQESSVWAVFGQLVYNFNDQWSTTLSLRYSEETKEADKSLAISELGGTTPTFDPYLYSIILPSLTPHTLTGKRTEESITPGINLQYAPNLDTRYYAAVSTGHKSGGFDPLITNGDPDDFEFDEEKVTAYEVGAKYRLLQGAASLQVALFRSDFDDVQNSTYDGLLDLSVTNAGETRSQGVEIETRALLTPDFTVSLIYSYLDAKYITFENARCYSGQTPAQGCIGGVRSLSGESTQFSPEHSASVSIDYVTRLFGNELRTTLDVNYMSEYYVTNDLDPYLDQDGYTKVNLRIGYKLPHWEFAFIGKNITDKLTYSTAIDLSGFPGSYTVVTNRPRTLALQATYRY